MSFILGPFPSAGRGLQSDRIHAFGAWRSARRSRGSDLRRESRPGRRIVRAPPVDQEVVEEASVASGCGPSRGPVAESPPRIRWRSERAPVSDHERRLRLEVERREIEVHAPVSGVGVAVRQARCTDRAHEAAVEGGFDPGGDLNCDRSSSARSSRCPVGQWPRSGRGEDRPDLASR